MKNEQEKHKMLGGKMTKPDYNDICLIIGKVMYHWGVVVHLLEESIYFFNPPLNEDAKSSIEGKNDKGKIAKFVKEYKKNPKYHNDLNDKKAEALLSAGLESRNYFAHRIFLIEDNVITTRYQQVDKTHHAGFVETDLESIYKERQNIIDTYNFLVELILKIRTKNPKN